MWSSLVQAWTERPLAGYGPGSFVWILPTTDYYQTSSLAPRHPDSAFFQLIGEGGLLGIASAAVVLVSLVPPVMRGRSTAARWALAAFVFASTAANATDFPFLIAVAVGWTAYAAPRVLDTALNDRRVSSIMHVAYLCGLAVVGIAFAATATAGLFYSEARRAAEDRDLQSAKRSLDMAILLDPAMALYPRQRGTLEYLAGSPSDGIDDLELAVRLNPSDDLAWRTLALAYDSVGDVEKASVAADRALANQRSDSANLLLRARISTELGHIEEARATLAEVVQAWPAIVAAPGWSSFLRR